MNNLVAPTDWRKNAQWFHDVSQDRREEWARLYCSRTFVWNGQTCVVFSYPRASGRVAFYDMDGGECHWIDVSSVATLERGRETDEQDFHWNAIMGHDACDEAGDIWNMLEDE